MTLRFLRTAVLLTGFWGSGCGIINGNGYRQLTAGQKAALHTFTPGLLDTTVPHQPAPFEVEVTGRQVAGLLRERPYTWIYQWVWYCQGPACRPLFYYAQQARRHRGDGLTLLLVSQVYDPAILQKHLTQWHFPHPVYVPAARAYGAGMYRARRRFTRELVPEAVASGMPAHLLFRRDTLLYAGADMTPALLDSLLR